MTKLVSVAEAKSHFSEYLSQVAFSMQPLIITKRNRPIAALVDLKKLNQLESIKESKGLASIAGKWEHFDEISDHIDSVVQAREKEHARDISL